MKKFTKVVLILATVFGIIGIGSLITAVSMGVAGGDLTEMIEEHYFHF